MFKKYLKNNKQFLKHFLRRKNLLFIIIKPSPPNFPLKFSLQNWSMAACVFLTIWTIISIQLFVHTWISNLLVCPSIYLPHIHIHTYSSFNSIQPWRPSLAGTTAKSCDRYGSGTLHPGQVLGGSLPLLFPAFTRTNSSRQVPPSATTREILAVKSGTVGEKDVRQ